MNNQEDAFLNPEESIKVLDRVLEQTRYNFGENKFGILFWGYFILAICLTHYVLSYLNVQNSFIPWLFTPLGWVITMLYYKKKHKYTATPVFTGKKIAFIWGLAGINMFIVGFLSWSVVSEGIIGIILIIYSLASFFTGVLIQYKPLIFASIVGNLIALVTLLYIPLEYQLLSMAAFVVVCSIVPGHLLPKQSY